MEKWQHLLIYVDTANHLTVAPAQRDLEQTLYERNPKTLLGLLDELGNRGWQLVTAANDEYWMKRPVEAPERQPFVQFG